MPLHSEMKEIIHCGANRVCFPGIVPMWVISSHFILRVSATTSVLLTSTRVAMLPGAFPNNSCPHKHGFRELTIPCFAHWGCFFYYFFQSGHTATCTQLMAQMCSFSLLDKMGSCFHKCERDVMHKGSSNLALWNWEVLVYIQNTVAGVTVSLISAGGMLQSAWTVFFSQSLSAGSEMSDCPKGHGIWGCWCKMYGCKACK